MNMKKTLLILFIAGLGTALSVNAQQGPQCKGGQCQRGQQRPEGQQRHQEHLKKRDWQDVYQKDASGKDVISPSIIEVKENNQWVQYKKSTKNCPSIKHRHWDHKHPEHRHAQQGQDQHAHKQWHHGSAQSDEKHKSGRHVKYQKNQDGSKVDGVMNVREKDGKCWEYVRTSANRNLTQEELDIILEESLQPD
jgi:hypothetical protein